VCFVLWARDAFRAGWAFVLHAAVVLKGYCSRSGNDWKTISRSQVEMYRVLKRLRIQWECLVGGEM
jgi:hypothetical protein